MKRGTWLENTRRNPREALEAELSVMVAGLVIAFVGGSAIFAGFVNRGGATNAQSLWGTVVFVVGLLFIVLGLSLAVVNLGVYISSRRRKD
jgi:high-affinity Fe2+/Pb2+ permease